MSVVRGEANQGNTNGETKYLANAMVLFLTMVPFLPFLHFESPKAVSGARFILFPLIPPQTGEKGRRGNPALLKK